MWPLWRCLDLSEENWLILALDITLTFCLVNEELLKFLTVREVILTFYLIYYRSSYTPESLIKICLWGRGFDSVVECFPSKDKALVLVPSSSKISLSG